MRKSKYFTSYFFYQFGKLQIIFQNTIWIILIVYVLNYQKIGSIITLTLETLSLSITV
jgi:hypothetical protein